MRSGFRPRQRPASTPASSAAVPVALSALNLKTAFSASACKTTGGTFCTALCSSGTSISALKSSFRPFFTGFALQAKMKMVRKTHGSHAFHAPGCAGADSACFFGFHTFMKSTSTAIATTALTISTSHGPW